MTYAADVDEAEAPQEALSEATLDAMVGVASSEIQEAAGDALSAVLLYGSAIGGGWKAARSNVNLLVVLARLDVTALRKLAKVVTSWEARTFVVHVTTVAELRASARVFPIHLLELQEHHRVLAGSDPVAGVAVTNADLLASAERELREITRAMIRATTTLSDDRRALAGAIRRHFRSFVYALRGVLRVLGKLPKTTDKHPTLDAAAKELGLDHALLLDLLTFRRRMKPAAPAEVDRLGEGLLRETTTAADRLAEIASAPR